MALLASVTAYGALYILFPSDMNVLDVSHCNEMA
jgi:hypothetical protein